MRPIKFRGKREHDKTWMFGGIYTEHNIAVIIETYAHFETVIPETVGQFTGCYDADGKEIYEGDIVKIKQVKGKNLDSFGRENIEVVTFDSYSGFSGISRIDRVERGIDEIKIIGNIHDNPELVQG